VINKFNEKAYALSVMLAALAKQSEQSPEGCVDYVEKYILGKKWCE
jgi:hypothetical protein